MCIYLSIIICKYISSPNLIPPATLLLPLPLGRKYTLRFSKVRNSMNFAQFRPPPLNLYAITPSPPPLNPYPLPSLHRES